MKSLQVLVLTWHIFQHVLREFFSSVAKLVMPISYVSVVVVFVIQTMVPGTFVSGSGVWNWSIFTMCLYFFSNFCIHLSPQYSKLTEDDIIVQMQIFSQFKELKEHMLIMFQCFLAAFTGCVVIAFFAPPSEPASLTFLAISIMMALGYCQHLLLLELPWALNKLATKTGYRKVLLEAVANFPKPVYGFKRYWVGS